MIHLDLEDARISHADFQTVSPWWKARGGESPSREMLPTLGVIASHHGQPLACCFAYLDATGSGVSQLAWMATNPAYAAIQRGRALNYLLDFLVPHIRELGYWLINATYHHPSIARKLRAHGFVTGDTGLVHQFLNLKTSLA